MYGYVVPNKDTLKASDFVLYRAFYCGLCCELGRRYGQLPRFTTNYDFTFLAALLHDYSEADIVIEEHKCVLNCIKKKAMVMQDPLMSALAAANIMLAYQKADDGVADRDGAKYRIARRALKKAFKKAKAAYPDIWTAIESGGKAQREVEEGNVNSIDRAADAFAGMLRELPEKILGRKTDDNFRSLCYNIGKFVYLTDALDDIEDDIRKKRYNPFIAAYGIKKQDFKGRRAFTEAHERELRFCLEGCAHRAADCLKNIRLVQSGRLLYNIVFEGIPAKIEQLLSSEKKLPPPKL